MVMTHNFTRDKDHLRSLLETETRHIAMLGPCARTRRLLDELATKGVILSERDRRRIRGRARLDLGAEGPAEGPEEIGTAICAEIVAVRRNRSAGFLKDRAGPIHERHAPPRT